MIKFQRGGSKRFPTFIQKKVKVLGEKTFPKYVDKLDKAMQKSGFRKVNDPNVQYRAYTNGTVVVDDVSPGNVGLTFFKKPKLQILISKLSQVGLVRDLLLKMEVNLNLNSF